MWNPFSTQSKKEKLEAEYFQLTEKAFEAESEDIKKAAKIRGKAQRVMMKIVELDK